jgi:hypothetical protein
MIRLSAQLTKRFCNSGQSLFTANLSAEHRMGCTRLSESAAYESRIDFGQRGSRIDITMFVRKF